VLQSVAGWERELLRLLCKIFKLAATTSRYSRDLLNTISCWLLLLSRLSVVVPSALRRWAKDAWRRSTLRSWFVYWIRFSWSISTDTQLDKVCRSLLFSLPVAFEAVMIRPVQYDTADDCAVLWKSGQVNLLFCATMASCSQTHASVTRRYYLVPT